MILGLLNGKGVLYLYNDNIIYALYHIYDSVIDDIVIRETKRIGFYTTREECKDVILKHHKYVGFRDYPISCFKILEYTLGEVYWKEEFVCDKTDNE